MLRSAVILLVAVIVASGQTPKKQVAPSNAQMSTGILAVASDQVGTLFVDGERKLDITPTKIVTLKLTAGQHFVDLRDAKGSKLWTKVVSVPAGAQVAESITVNGNGITSLPNSNSPNRKVALTQCEEMSLLARWQEAAKCCRSTCQEPTIAGCGFLLIDDVQVNDYALSLQIRGVIISADSGVTSAKKEIQEMCGRTEKSESWRQGVCMSATYELGDYEKALSQSNKDVGEWEQSWRTLQSYRQLGNRISIPQANSYGVLGSSYRFRAIVKYALSDTNGALADLQNSLDRYAEYREYLQGEEQRSSKDVKRESAEDVKKALESLDSMSSSTHLLRSLILYRLGKYEEAIADFNERVADWISSGFKYNPDNAEKRLGELIRKGLGNPGVTDQAKTQQHASTSSLKEEIEEAEKSGRTSPLPNAEPCRLDGSIASGMVRYEMKNATAFDLRVVLSGRSEQEIRLAPNSSQTATITAGTYKILGRVNSPSVVPFFGKRAFAPGAACGSEFYVERKP